MPNLIIEEDGRVVILVHNGMPYSAGEWRAIVDLAARPNSAELRFLVYDDGGTIDSAQRKEIVAAMGGRMPKCAVLTDSRISRGITTAIGWFKPDIKAFARDHFPDAARHLGLTTEEAARASSAAIRMLRQVPNRSA